MFFLGTLLLSNITVTLPSEAKVKSSEILLGQIATVSGADAEQVARLQRLELGYAPSPGFTRVLHAWKIQDQIARQFADLDVEFAGEDICRVWPEVSVVKGEDLVEKAASALEVVFSGADVEVQPNGTVEDQTVPTGIHGHELVATPTLATSSVNSLRAGVWNVPVQVVIDGMPYRTVWTSFDVNIYRDMPVLVRDIASNQKIGPGDVVIRRTAQPKGMLVEPLNKRRLLGAIAKRFLRKGEPVTDQDVTREAAVEEGETVILQVENNAILVNARVIALKDGYVDDLIPVQVVGTLKELTARVTRKGHLELILDAKGKTPKLQSN